MAICASFCWDIVVCTVSGLWQNLGQDSAPKVTAPRQPLRDALRPLRGRTFWGCAWGSKNMPKTSGSARQKKTFRAGLVGRWADNWIGPLEVNFGRFCLKTACLGRRISSETQSRKFVSELSSLSTKSLTAVTTSTLLGNRHESKHSRRPFSVCGELSNPFFATNYGSQVTLFWCHPAPNFCVHDSKPGLFVEYPTTVKDTKGLAWDSL